MYLIAEFKETDRNGAPVVDWEIDEEKLEKRLEEDGSVDFLEFLERRNFTDTNPTYLTPKDNDTHYLHICFRDKSVKTMNDLAEECSLKVAVYSNYLSRDYYKDGSEVWYSDGCGMHNPYLDYQKQAPGIFTKQVGQRFLQLEFNLVAQTAILTETLAAQVEPDHIAWYQFKGIEPINL